MGALITFPFGILLLLLSWIQFSHQRLITPPSLAIVNPDDPSIEEGDTLVLNCTLKSNYTGPYNASDLFFFFSTRNYAYPYVKALSNITAEFRLPNVTLDMHGACLCKLPNTYLGADATQAIHIIRRPLKPVLDGCVISNWNEMECSWSPSRDRQDDHTIASKSFNLTFFYQLPGDNGNWKKCPQQLNTSEKCIFPASQFTMGANYCIQINATNRLNRTVASDVTCVLAQDDIVKPNHPENVQSSSSSSSEFDGHVTLTWNPPTSSYDYEMPLIYQLDIRNNWDDQISNVTTETSMPLSVVPATKYTFEISVRPARLGFASDKVVLEFVTPATVPCKNPLTQKNAFFLVKESRKVLLYWQPISKRDFCGYNHSYQVRAGQSSHGATNGADIWRDVNLDAQSDSSAEVTLLGDEDEVTIQSENSIGLANHLPLVRLRLPHSSSRGNYSSSHRLVVEGDDNSIMVHWFAVAPVRNVTSYTLFWCQRLQFTRRCQSPIQWQNLDVTEFEYNLTLSENYLHFQIGLAVNFLSGTTGIMWAEKLYSQTAKADPPHIEAPYLGSHGEIDVSWTAAQCHIQRCAYVHSFVISYCLADHQDNCHGEIQNVDVPSWKNFSYTLTNLEHGSAYRIWMTCVARTGSSETSSPVYATTTKSLFTAGVVAGIIAAILCVGTIAIAGVYIVLRRLNRYRTKFVNGLPIALPPTHRVQIPSTSSEAPMLGSKFEYSRQESGSSGDSGRYSLSPASPATSPLLSKLPDANENIDSFIPRNFGALEEVKVEDDDDSTRGCVLSYTIVASDEPKGEPTMPNGIAKSVNTLPNGSDKMGDVTNPSVAPNGGVKYVLPEQIELLGVFPENPDSDINYCTSFSFPLSSTGNNTTGNSAADIGYTKVENLQPLYDLVDRLPTADGVDERSLDSGEPQFDSNQDGAPVEQSDLLYTIDQLLATLSADPPLANDPQIDNPATGSDSVEPKLSLPPPPPPRPGDGEAPFRGYMKIANTDFPSLACEDVQWGSSKPDLPQQPTLTNWGYVDHAMFGVDSVA